VDLIQQLCGTVDLMFVGKLIGRDAFATVGSSGLTVTCIVGFFTGLSVGAGKGMRLHGAIHA
jgi:Na+-driven multidrug efflux pump